MILVEPEIRAAFARRLRVTALRQFVEDAQAAVKLRGDVSVLLTGDRQIRRWNREFRGKNQATDVLSFPAIPMAGIASAMAGDLAISVETADKQAKEQGHVLAEELKVLVLHGLLHLAGYDHETDDGTMARVERRLRARLGLKAGLTERVAVEPVKKARSSVPTQAKGGLAWATTEGAPVKKAAAKSLPARRRAR
ncbi:MAG: rRNA maturation RNase YbeY [Acidobacteriaceae bacterium]